MKRFLAFLCLFILNISLSHAAVTINVVQSGSDVVATASGSLTLTGLPGPESFSSAGSFFDDTSSSDTVYVGTGRRDMYTISTNVTFITGLSTHFATSASGSVIGFVSADSVDRLNVPEGYSSGDPIASTATWSGKTIADIGLIPGTYNVSWGSDSITLNIGGSVTPTTYSLGGTISGLTGSVTLQNNGVDDLTKSADGSFTFATKLAEGDNYAVTVSSHPSGQTCSVSNANNTMPAADVTNISVVCTNNAFIESAVLSVDASKFYFDVVITDTAGETSGELIFRIATEGLGIGGATDKQRIAINFDTITGAVTRSNEVQEFGSPPHDRWTLGTITDLSITASASDGWHIVGSVLHGTEPYVAGDIVSDVQFRLSTATGTRNLHMPDVVVTAASAPPATYTVGGTVSGLTGSVTLQNNGGDDIIKTTNDGFTFAAQDEGTDYAVTVSSQPAGQTCAVTNGSGTNLTADVTNVVVSCVTDALPTHTVSGTVSGLTGSVTLQNNGGDDIIKTTNDGFTFAAQDEGTNYAVTVSSQPAGQTCTVTNGSGTNITADVTNVVVSCVTDALPTHTVSGIVSGLTGSVTLQNNGGDDIIKTTNDGFTFAAQDEGTDYAVTVSSQPAGQTCTVTNGSGTNITTDVTNVSVACADNPIAPPVPATPIPTLSKWALILLSMLLGLVAFARVGRQQTWLK